VFGSPEDCWNQLQPTYKNWGVTHFVFRTHFLGMPLSSAMASMRLCQKMLLPALHSATPTRWRRSPLPDRPSLLPGTPA
jgi:hypothetical protein